MKIEGTNEEGVSGPGGAALEGELRARLAEEPDIIEGTLAVSCVGGHVVLAGEVPDKEAFDRVEALVHAEPGVEEVENLVTITAKQERDRRMAAVLQKRVDEEFPTLEVEVSVVGPVAILQGYIAAEDAKEEVERIVADQPDVERVVNHIRGP